jgi:4-hydroxy-3-polyprenylbenzoate decarboxylase
MSFVKHAIFVDESAPKLDNYEAFATYVLNRFQPKSMFISEGILDALDHSSPESLVGGKLGIDATAAHKIEEPVLLTDLDLLVEVKKLIPDTIHLKQFMKHTKNPVAVITLNKTKKVNKYFEALEPLKDNLKIVVFVDEEKNDVTNPYMLIWRVTNNMDAQRDVFVSDMMVGVDGTNKNAIDSFTREWPDDVDCTLSVVESLKTRGLWDLDDNLYNKFQLV